MSLSSIDMVLAQAAKRAAFLRPALIRVDQGCSIARAAKWLAECKPDSPSAATVARWIRATQRHGLNGLLTSPAKRHTRKGGE